MSYICTIVEYAMVLTTWRFVFVYLLYPRTITHRYNYFSIKGKQTPTLVVRGMYYGLMFLHAKQCKTIHDELTMTYLLPEQTK